MNRETESHFAQIPKIDMSRSRFTRAFNHKTTFDAASLVPFLVDDILPGDTIKIDMAAVLRMSTPIYPVMDNCFADIYYFFVPRRLCWEHWREFMGENTLTHWEQPTEYTIPQITAPANGWGRNTIADYMGIPTYVPNLSVDAMPFRAYALIYNEWFRDQNLKNPCMVNLDDATQTGSNGSNYITDVQKGGQTAKVAKYHDYFTSALPAPQKGPDVLLPIGGISGTLPVVGNGMTIGLYSANAIAGHNNFGLRGVAHEAGTLYAVNNAYGTTAGTNETIGTDADAANTNVGLTQDPTKSGMVALATAPQNSSTIAMLRQAFQIQKLYERDARGGTRYREILRSHFGVVSPDASQQVPEYLGGTRVAINMSQVVQTSSTDSTSPQGNTAAISHTSFKQDGIVTKSFTEHGFLIGLIAVRTDHTYQQGIERFWSRKGRFDFYWPTLANISEQAILNKEIYAKGTSEDDQAFGYQEAWADYRYKPSRVSGAMRSNYPEPLDAWHYADWYNTRPTLSSSWIDETTTNIDRTLAVQSTLAPQFIADIQCNLISTRPMPMYSVPGLIDHH